MATGVAAVTHTDVGGACRDVCRGRGRRGSCPCATVGAVRPPDAITVRAPLPSVVTYAIARRCHTCSLAGVGAHISRRSTCQWDGAAVQNAARQCKSHCPAPALIVSNSSSRRALPVFEEIRLCSAVARWAMGFCEPCISFSRNNGVPINHGEESLSVTLYSWEKHRQQVSKSVRRVRRNGFLQTFSFRRAADAQNSHDEKQDITVRRARCRNCTAADSHKN